MNERQRYEEFDLPFYRERVAHVLPPKVLDFHTHVWLDEHWRVPALDVESVKPTAGESLEIEPGAKGQRYMMTSRHYPVEQLLADGKSFFPDKTYEAVIFGQPTPSAFTEKTNGYVVECARRPGLYGLRITGRDREPAELIEQEIVEQGYFGYKVFLDWMGNNYGDITVADQIGPNELEIADRHNLVVLLHVPQDERLAHPGVRREVREIAQRYPNMQLVLAHCGRCYLFEQMAEAAPHIADLPNVFVDTSMVMDPMVLQVLFESMDSKRILYGSDVPPGAMRGRRVRVMDHWVDVVLEGYPPSQYRVASDNMRATFMATEIVLAIEEAAQMAGITREQLHGVYYDNGIEVLGRIRDGKALEKARERWAAVR